MITPGFCYIRIYRRTVFHLGWNLQRKMYAKYFSFNDTSIEVAVDRPTCRVYSVFVRRDELDDTSAHRSVHIASLFLRRLDLAARTVSRETCQTLWMSNK